MSPIYCSIWFALTQPWPKHIQSKPSNGHINRIKLERRTWESTLDNVADIGDVGEAEGIAEPLGDPLSDSATSASVAGRVSGICDPFS